ncbi:MAG: LLM class flavin-dependent oxidoreductase [Chloroflexota bacterium]|nr:LLM class flavin-dependent oxidoreductase [Chloroflexota bacterium]
MTMADVGALPRPTHPWVAEDNGKVRFGVSMLWRSDWSAYLEWVQEAEALGFDSVWAQDHPPRYPDWGTTLAALAMKTTTIRLGSYVSCVYYRSPLLLARTAADIDQMSNGRFVLGIGIGYGAGEFAQFGLSIPRVSARQAALAETIQIIEGIWGGQPFTFEGKHFQVVYATVRPSIKQPRIPILIAGGGERVTLRQVAQYADMSNFGDVVTQSKLVDHGISKYAALRRHCEAVERPYESILRSHTLIPLIVAETRNAADAKLDAFLATLPPQFRTPAFREGIAAMTPHEAVGYYRQVIAAGTQYCIATTMENDFETLRLLASHVIPEVQGA